MKIYVAGKWKERKKVKDIMDMFESRGHIITCDWTKHIAPERYLVKDGHGVFDKDYKWENNIDWAENGHKTYAEEDLEGVRNCDVFVAYMPDETICYKGAWIEMGIALGLNKKVILIGNKIFTVFLGLSNIIVVKYKEESFDIIDSMQFNIDYDEGAKNKDTDHFVM